MIGQLYLVELCLLLELVVIGQDEVVWVMVDVGWFIVICGGDIDGSVLNWVVFCGNVLFVCFLFVYGVYYDECYGYNDNVYGMFSFVFNVEIMFGGNWLVCVQVLIDVGLFVFDKCYVFFEEIVVYFDGLCDMSI